jgi:hypothetical protein
VTPFAIMDVMRLVLVPFVLVCALLLACGGGDDDDTTGPSPTPESAADLLARSAAAMQDVTSFHFKLTHQNGSTPLPLSLKLDTAEGDVVIPAHLSAKIEAEHTTGIDVSVDVIAIDDDVWITNPFNRKWQRLPGASVSDFADPETLVRSLVGALTDPRIDGTGKNDGVGTVKLVASLDSGQLQDALTIARPGTELQVEAWIGAEDALPRRIRIIGPLTSGEDQDVTRQIDLSRFDEPVEIDPP